MKLGRTVGQRKTKTGGATTFKTLSMVPKSLDLQNPTCQPAARFSGRLAEVTPSRARDARPDVGDGLPNSEA